MKAFVLLLLLALPAASAADTAVLTFQSVQEARLVVDDARSQADSNFLRRTVDAFGDRDGMVSEEEGAQAAAIARPTVEREIDRQVGNGNLTLDGRQPATAELKLLTLSNVTGPVEQVAPVVAHVEVGLTFGVTPGANHTLFTRVRPDAGEYNTTVRLPPGYVSANGSTSVQFVVMPGGEGRTILFQVPPEEGAANPSPAGGLGLALWAVGGALVARRLTSTAAASAAAARRRAP